MEELDKLEKARDSMHDFRFPGEEAAHRVARDDLVQAEIEFRQQT